MKSKISFFLAGTLMITAMAFNGCTTNNEPETGTISFGMEQSVTEVMKSAADVDYRVNAALVTIVNSDGEKVFDKEYLEFYHFGDAFVTRSLKLNVGNYNLTEFMLIDSTGTVLWATPAEGSRLAGMVNDPVPIQFTVYADNTTRVIPEVVRIGNYEPADFGYVNFAVRFVDRLCIKVFFESYCDDWYNDSILMLADPNITAPYYPSRMIVYSGQGKLLTESYLVPGENKILIPRGYELYKLVVLDCGSQVCFSDVFGPDELRMFSCAEGDFLQISCGPVSPEVVITPDDVLEPTIEQGVFGRITEPAPDTTMTEEYTVRPLVTEIYIYDYAEGDTLWRPGTDCYVYPDMYTEPHVIVRSNIHGYYQFPLTEGKYSYMVKTPFGYYIDMYVSSHQPGLFEVKAGEITKLNIHIQPCIWF